ncbi:MAG: FAD-dependent oxidoreductase, partial [Bradyrhizobium sp.]
MTSHKTDVVIIGGGFAGATAAAMLGRAGIETVLIEPHAEKRPEFRCEKLSASQLSLLNLTGLAQDILPETSINQEVWIVRYGRLIDRRPTAAAGFYYHDFVNALNRIIPDSVRHFQTKARRINHDGASPVIELATGEEIISRVAILATGVNPGLRASAGASENILSQCHSISIGFDLSPVGRPSFDFPALTYFPDRPSQSLAYLTLFPVPGAMRANLFVYWSSDDPRLQQFRHNCAEALLELIPNLEQFTGEFSINGHVSIRPVDLFRSTVPTVPGVVLAGDAYSTSCPAAGTGSDKVLTDVRLL